MAVTNKGVIYPTSGDNIAPLETHFANLASSADKAGVATGAFAIVGQANAGTVDDFIVTFGQTFPTAPKVVATVQGGAAPSCYALTIAGAPTTTGFTARIYKLNGTVSETDLKIVWYASTY